MEANASQQNKQEFKKQFWNQSVIYAWVNKQTFQCYIGSGKQAQKRPFDHLRSEKLSNLNLQQAFKDFGKDHFVLIILDKVAESCNVTKHQLEMAENDYLQKIPRSLQYNVAWYAYTSGFITDEVKKKISLRIQGSKNPMFGIKGFLAPGYHKKGSSNHMYGKKHTLEARQKISEKAYYRFQNQKQKQILHYRAMPVRFLNVKTKEITQPFDTLCVAAKFLGYHTSKMIRKALKDPNLILGDQWRVISLTQEQYLVYLEKHQK